MIIVFDLDDTLYPEITYVHSGFKSVSKYLAQRFDLNFDTIYNLMIAELEANGRGLVFDNTLKSLNIFNKILAQKCISTYRLHDPIIALYPYSLNCLNYLKDHKIYLVTDGNKIVQKKKVEALGIESYFKKIYITHRYGVKNAKPSTYCFNKIINKEKAKPKDLWYIADNPRKDFVNLKKENFNTIRVLTGNYKNDNYGEEYEADMVISDLRDLNKIIK